MDAALQLTKVLNHYMRQLAQASGLQWTQQNESDIGRAIGDLVAELQPSKALEAFAFDESAVGSRQSAEPKKQKPAIVPAPAPRDPYTPTEDDMNWWRQQGTEPGGAAQRAAGRTTVKMRREG